MPLVLSGWVGYCRIAIVAGECILSFVFLCLCPHISSPLAGTTSRTENCPRWTYIRYEKARPRRVPLHPSPAAARVIRGFIDPKQANFHLAPDAARASRRSLRRASVWGIGQARCFII
jgi:hypothetical protein